MTSFRNVDFDQDGIAETSGKITIYNFKSSSGLYFGSAEEYITQGVGLPAHLTLIAPPSIGSGKLYLFSNGSCHLVEDHRGEIVFDIKTGEPVFIHIHGDYPENTTIMKPITKFDVWNGTKWVTDVDAQQVAQLEAGEQKRTALLDNAKAKISLWQTELQLGLITDKDKASLINWLTYIRELKTVKIEQTSDVTWTLTPEESAS